MRYDVAIIGAGPSGSLAALIIARSGRKVLLIDRSPFPRPKVCGDCINPSSEPIWERLGLTESYRKLPFHQVTGLTIECEDQEILSHRFGDKTQGSRVIARSVLDEWLLEQARLAGVEIHLNTAVESLNCESGALRTQSGEFLADHILGADGRNSFSARAAGLSAKARRCNRIAWQTTLSIKDDLGRLDDHVHLRIFPEGYYGLVRINESEANLCFVLDCKTPQKVDHLAARYFPKIGEQAWRTVNPISRDHAVLGKDRLWLMGDAARVVEPFTGEGIYFALASAELAANSLIAGQSLAHYEAKHRALYRSRVWVNDLVRLALLKPKRALFFGRLLSHAPGVLRFASEKIHQRGMQPVLP